MTFKVICYYLKDLVCTAAADARSVCGIAIGYILRHFLSYVAENDQCIIARTVASDSTITKACDTL